jgi:hypothetical protein
VINYPACVDCAAPVKFRDRNRCHACHRRVVRAAAKRLCPRCGQLRHLQPSGTCAACVRAAAPRKPPKTITCMRCGEQRRNAGHGLCNRCTLADPDRPFRYAASMARRMGTVPAWWHELTAFVAARYHPGGAMTILRKTARILTAEPTVSAQQILHRCPPLDESTTLIVRALTAFFTGRGLALPDDEAQQRAAARRQRYLDAIPAPLHLAVIAFDRAQLDERDRDRRVGRRQLSDITLETRLRILRDLAKHLITARQVTGWAEVTSGDLEVYLTRTPSSRHQQTYVLRRFFGWAKRRKLILTNPTQRLRLGSQPGFTGTVLGIAKQRTLFRRWASDAVHPHERLIGLLALLHAASNAEIRTLTVTNVDPSRQAVRLSGRPFPTPLDPATWAALDACLLHRIELHTLNPHLVVTGVTRTRDTPADSTYLTRALASSGTTPSACRQTRLAQLVTDLDPKLTAAALGMHDTGLVRYLADNVDHDRIKRTIR